MAYSELFLKKNEDRRLRQGHLWIFSNEVDVQRSPLTNFAVGEIVTVKDSGGQALGLAYINPNMLICARLLSRKPNANIGENFFKQRVERALYLRERLFDRPYYRLIFAESDGLPGLVVDRFGDVLSVQISTQGMEQQKSVLIKVLSEVLQPKAIWLKNDSAQRQVEALSSESELAFGEIPKQLLIEENGLQFVTDITQGQKTGWFYDHRMSRGQLAKWTQGLKVLDLFSYAGAWGMPAAVNAESVVCVDSSATALDWAAESARMNKLDHKMQFVKSDVFDFLKQMRDDNQRFDAIVLDPPALIKRKKDFKTGFEAYRRLNQMALQILNVGGMLVSASCSHHLSRENLHEILRASSRHVDRDLLIIGTGGQGPDHPVHPAIPETDYLKTFFCSVSSRG